MNRSLHPTPSPIDLMTTPDLRRRVHLINKQALGRTALTTWSSTDQPLITITVVGNVLIWPNVGHKTKIDVSNLFWIYAAWVYPAAEPKDQIVYFLGNTS